MNCSRKRVKRERMDYRERLMQAIGQVRGDALRGHVSTVHVRHDTWCRLLKQRGACNCDPDMTLTCADGLFTIDRQGNARRNRHACGRADG